VRIIRCSRLLIGIVLLLSSSTTIFAQHTKRDLSFSFAKNGEVPFVTSGRIPFFTNPFIWNIKYQVWTRYILSASFALEHVAETRNRQGIWVPLGSPANPNLGYNAYISEHLSMTTLYLEVARTVLRTDEFRIAIGGDLGYGIGSATADVEKIIGHAKTNYESQSPWTSFFLGAFVRARLTVYSDDLFDIGLTATARYWSMPTLGPLSDGRNAGGYYGPNIGGIHELGYLAGISIGMN
jgi:hypothetical protein